jgi:hypothetical protein
MPLSHQARLLMIVYSAASLLWRSRLSPGQ